MRSTRVERKKPGRKSNSGLKKESGRWRPTTRQVFWAIGVVVTLMTIALLVVQLHPGLWEDLSREPVAMLKGRVATLIGLGVALTVLIVLLAKGSASLGWTGFRGKTLWDLLQLLVVPLMLALITVVFTWQQNVRQNELEDQRTRQAQNIENQRAEAERELAEQRAQDEALQAYLDHMSTLLLGEEKLRESEVGSEVRTLAQARTITVLERLDPRGKRVVMQFLAQTELVKSVEGREPIIQLSFVDLSRANLSGGGDHLRGANLFQANLSGADLSYADLRGTNLFQANLSGADLSNTDLRGADLNGATLSEVDLSDADLEGARIGNNYRVITNEELEQLEHQAKALEGATMPDGTVFSDEFEPALSLNLGGSLDWYISEAQTPNSLSISGPEEGQLLFTNPRHVFDPSNLSEPKKLPGPENADEWVSWFQKHPNLETSKPVPASVEDASGKQIDVTVTSTPENYPQEVCGEQPCVPLYRGLTSESTNVGFEGLKDRYVIVDVGDDTVIIDVAAPADRFDEFLPKAQKVLDTVEWKGG